MLELKLQLVSKRGPDKTNLNTYEGIHPNMTYYQKRNDHIEY